MAVPGPSPAQPTQPRLVFSAVDPTDVRTDAAAVRASRADTPDSGQGGYFTQSESESGASTGSQSPVELQHIYKISKGLQREESNIPARQDNRKTKSTLLSYQDVSGRERSRSQDQCKGTGRSVTNTQTNKVNNNKAKLPPRPPRPSSSLPPPVPKKQRERIDAGRRSNSVSRRPVVPPERRPISGKTLPLQIQSPSIVQALRAAGKVTDKAKPSSPTKHQSANNCVASSSGRSVNIPPGKSIKHVERNGLNGPEKIAAKIPARINQTQRDAVKLKEPIKANKSTKENVPTYSLKASVNNNKGKSKVASESLASRAKRTTEDKVKQLYSSFRSPKQERKLNFSDRRKNLQREDMIINTNSCESDFPKQPVQSLIKLYDKSRVKPAAQINKHGELKSNNSNSSAKQIAPVKTTKAMKLNQKCVNVVANGADDTKQHSHGQQNSFKKSGSGKGNEASSDRIKQQSTTKLKKETRPSSSKTNSIDEFLLSAKRTRQKYQNMLISEEKTETDNLEVKTDPSESDLQTGCFTDVSYAGYFAKQSGNDQKLNDISICGNTSNLDGDQNKLCKQPSVHQEAEAADVGEHMVVAHPDSGGTCLSETNNTELANTTMMPTPSPRLKKKQRREQILQEHKQLGKMVLAKVKNNIDQDQSRVEDQKIPQTQFDEISLVPTDKCQGLVLRNEMKVVQSGHTLMDMENNDSLKQQFCKLERDIQILTNRCNILEKEKQDAVQNLLATQVMSSEQIEKLCILERKQDFLEAENKQTREKLLNSENELNKLTNQYMELEKSKIAIDEENSALVQRIMENEELIKRHGDKKSRESDAINHVVGLDIKIDDLQNKIEELIGEKLELESKLDVQMSDHFADIKKIRDAYQLEKESLDDQLCSLKEKFNGINDLNEKLLFEKKQLDEKLSKLNQLDYEDCMDQLKLELKQSKALLRDAQMNNTQDAGSEKIIKQLKSQLEDAELEKSASLRKKKNIEMDILDLQDNIADLRVEKKEIEVKYENSLRENHLLNHQLKDNEEELENILSKYKSSISTLTDHQSSLQNQAVIIAELENENINLFDKIEALQKKIKDNEEDANQNVVDKKSELRINELEYQLQLELTSKTRCENQIEQFRDKLLETEKEQETARKSVECHEEINKKLNIQIKDLKEDIVTLQIREMDITEKKNILDKKLEIAEAETITVRSQLELANRRIEDLQIALNCDTESESSSIPYSDGYQDDLDLFLLNHRKRMAEQKEEERKIRESLLKESKAESDC